MLRVEKAFNLLLRDTATITAIVGQRIYAAFAPQTSTYPLLVHRSEGRLRHRVLDGIVGLRDTRIRVFSTAKTYDEAKELDEAVKLAIDAFAGIVSDDGSPAETLQIQTIDCESSEDTYIAETKTHQIVTDYIVVAHEEVPS